MSSVDSLLTEWHRRSRATVRDRWRRVRANAMVALQAGIAAGLAWLLAHDVIGHPRPFFAPIAAVITLGVSVGQRLRRAAELVFGVALGIAVGDALIYLIGTGAWQIALVVVLAMVVAVFLGGSAPLVSQSASSAVLVATLAPPSTGIYYTRFIDALVGGGVALAVMALLLPANPLTVVSRAAGATLSVLSEGLAEAAAALAAGDGARARTALTRLREGENDLTHFRDALPAGRETATLAPLRWRARGPLAQYVDAAKHVTRALRNARVLVRRSVTLLANGEPV
ncbi:MAG TPA: FUSC family protein, partial [Micromonosporaceae bacterium]|nr:FUSC family protein [Micromonosporaceae bacterium]